MQALDMLRRSDKSFMDWVDEYQLTHPIEPVTAKHYRTSIRVIERYGDTRLAATTVNDRLVNQSLAAMHAAGKAADYIRSVKAAVLVIWRDMAECGLCQPPGRIRSVRCIPRRPIVWAPEQIAGLVRAAGTLEGEFRTLPLSRPTYWQTLIRVAWDSALRRKDLHCLTANDIQAEFIWQQHKTHKPVRIRLRESTITAILEWERDDDGPLWPLWGSDNSFLQDWHKIVQRAGVPYGPFKRIRKSAGTYAEMTRPGAGHYLLGNTREVFERSYLDPLRVDVPQPPELEIR